MGSVDNFLQAHVQRGLEPGESIRFMGLLRNPSNITKGIIETPASYHEFLGVATDRRLILFRTQVEGFNIKALPNATQAHEWRYEDLASVHLRASWWPLVHSGGKAQIITLTPRPNLGPAAVDAMLPGGYYDDTAKPRGPERRYDMYLSVVDLDANTQMFHQFPGWLQQAVASGQFPLSAQRQGEAARNAELRRQKDAADAAASAAALAKAGRTGLKILWLALMALCLLGGGFATFTAFQATSKASADAARLERELEIRKQERADVKRGVVPDCEAADELRHTPGNRDVCGECMVVDTSKSTRPADATDRVLTAKGKPNVEYRCPEDARYAHQENVLESSLEAAQRGGRTPGLLIGLAITLIGGGLFGFLAFRKKKPVAPAR